MLWRNRIRGAPVAPRIQVKWTGGRDETIIDIYCGLYINTGRL